jgi:hypothetical protein
MKNSTKSDGTLVWEAPVWLQDALGSCELPPQSEDDDCSSNDELLTTEGHPLGFV